MLRRLLAVLAVLAAVPAGAGVVRSSTNVSGSGGGTFTGGTITSPILAPGADNCAAPPYSFSGATNTGVCSSAADTLDLRTGGVSLLKLDTNLTLASGKLIIQDHLWFGPSSANNSELYCPRGGTTCTFETTNGAAFVPITVEGLRFRTDLKLERDAANTLALRNSTNAQTFNWYYSYTDASNYHRGALKTSASGISIEAETAGSGADNLDVTLTPVGSGAVKIPATAGYPAFRIQANGNSRVYAGTVAFNNSGYMAVLDDNAAGTEMGVGYLRGSLPKTLTDAAAAAAFVRVAVPQTVGSNYAGGDVIWTAFAADATPHTQSLSGRLTFTAINNAGTEVCAVDPTAAVTAPNANSSGTLQCTFSCASNAADTIDLMATCDTSLGTPTALSLLYRLDMPQPNTVTPQ